MNEITITSDRILDSASRLNFYAKMEKPTKDFADELEILQSLARKLESLLEVKMKG